MIVVVTGGRDFTDAQYVFDSLSRVHAIRKISTLIHGDAKGVDRLCRDWARENNVPVIEEPVSSQDYRYGKRGPIRRNQRMLDKYSPQVLIHFPGRDGTRDMVTRSIASGLIHIDFAKGYYNVSAVTG